MGGGVDGSATDKALEALASSSRLLRSLVNTPIPDPSPIEGEGGDDRPGALIEYGP